MCLPNILFRVIMFAFIFHCRLFSLCWPLAFLIFSPPLCLPRNLFPLFLMTRSSSFFVIHVSVNVKNNAEKYTTLLLFFLSKSPGGHVISFHLGCHTGWLRYFTLVSLWCEQTLAPSVYGHVITKFPRMGRLPHFLSYFGKAGHTDAETV